MDMVRHLKLMMEIKIKTKNNKLMFFTINDERLLERYKPSWTKIDNLKYIELNALPFYDDRYIKANIKNVGR